MPRKKRSNGRDRTNTEIRESFKNLCELIIDGRLALVNSEINDIMDPMHAYIQGGKIGIAMMLYKRLFPGKVQQTEAEQK